MAAYAICVDDGRILLARWVGPSGERHWTLPGGTLRHEVGGSTDRAAWVPLDEVAGLERAEVVDIGLELHRVRPGNGRVD
ncbi:hypothetical protein AB0L65_38370 [Nonomuraea sp. NPDC052116]|uniref:hypothetical protein n=1 Tax=Nonomuraea sp. NPDC052116 TaxID=3155665 RepID=UPI0034260DA1